MIPNIIHFVFGFKEVRDGEEFLFSHFLAIATAAKIHRPEKILFHYQHEPRGHWWEKSKPFLTLNPVTAPEHIYGNYIEAFQHRADVTRLQALYEHGGIYLDIDVVSVNNLKPLLGNDAVLGTEPGEGLCNAVILAKPGSEFIRIWLESYKTFTGKIWGEHSIHMPLKLAGENPDLISVQDEFAFFYPMYNDPSYIYLFREAGLFNDLKVRLRLDRCKGRGQYLKHCLLGRRWQLRQLQKSYVVHLWDSFWQKPYLSQMDPQYLLERDNNFAALMRETLGETYLAELAADLSP